MYVPGAAHDLPRWSGVEAGGEVRTLLKLVPSPQSNFTRHVPSRTPASVKRSCTSHPAPTATVEVPTGVSVATGADIRDGDGL